MLLKVWYLNSAQSRIYILSESIRVSLLYFVADFVALLFTILLAFLFTLEIVKLYLPSLKNCPVNFLYKYSKERRCIYLKIDLMRLGVFE